MKTIAVVFCLLCMLFPAVVSAEAAPSPAPQFLLGFKTLADKIPDVVGSAVEEEHHGANGDGLQTTTNGLMVWRKADNWTAFTNGNWTWINGPYGLQDRANTDRFPWEADDRLALSHPQQLSSLASAVAPQLPQVVSGEFDAATEEAALSMINGSRAQFGVPPVVMDEAIRQVARSRAKDMAVRNYFGHVNPDGKNAFDLMRAAGISFGWAAENIGMGTGYGAALDCVQANHNAMMAETPPDDGHRVNILNASLKKVGIGVYRTSDGRTYYVTDYTD